MYDVSVVLHLSVVLDVSNQTHTTDVDEKYKVVDFFLLLLYFILVSCIFN